MRYNKANIGQTDSYTQLRLQRQLKYVMVYLSRIDNLALEALLHETGYK